MARIEPCEVLSKEMGPILDLVTDISSMTGREVGFAVCEHGGELYPEVVCVGECDHIPGEKQIICPGKNLGFVHTHPRTEGRDFPHPSPADVHMTKLIGGDFVCVIMPQSRRLNCLNNLDHIPMENTYDFGIIVDRAYRGEGGQMTTDEYTDLGAYAIAIERGMEWLTDRGATLCSRDLRER